MGWDFCDAWRTKADVLREQLDPRRFGGEGYKLLASQSVSEGYLAVWETHDGERWLETTLVQKSRGCFGVKTMSESMGPVEFDGAAEMLFSLVPTPPNEYAAKFRERVRSRRKPGARAKLTVYPQSQFLIPNVAVE